MINHGNRLNKQTKNPHKIPLFLYFLLNFTMPWISSHRLVFSIHLYVNVMFVKRLIIEVKCHFNSIA